MVADVAVWGLRSGVCSDAMGFLLSGSTSGAAELGGSSGLFLKL